MKRAAPALVALLAVVATGCGGSGVHTIAPHAVARGPLLGGQVLVVATPGTGVRICGSQNSDLMFGPPGCGPGLRVVGLDTDLLHGRSAKPAERWGYVYLVGRYRNGVFSITSQRLHGPPTQPAGTVTFDRPPCAAPHGGWLLQTPSIAQRSTVDHYSRLAHHHDLVDIAFYGHGAILTVASSDPARTRAVLGRYWPRQLCVIKARYARSTLVGVGRRMVRLMSSPDPAKYGWISGAGGTCGSNDGQPRTCVEVLLETTQMRALVRTLPRGILGVDAVLRPVKRRNSALPVPLSTALALTKHVPCRSGRRHQVGRSALGRFHAVTAVMCTGGFRTYPGQGQWEVLIRRVAVGSVRRLQRAFERPDERHVPKNVACAAVYIVIPIPTFVDDRGHWLTPHRWPVGGCGQPLGYDYKKGPPIRWHVVSVHRIKQVVTAAAVAANCPMRMGNTVAWAGPPRDSAGGSLFARAPKTVRVCIFRTPPDNFAVGDFVRGFRVDGSQTRRLLAALTGPGPRRGCPKQRTFAAVIGGPGSGATVELGGCYRVERPDRTAGTAKPAVIRAILGVR